MGVGLLYTDSVLLSGGVDGEIVMSHAGNGATLFKLDNHSGAGQVHSEVNGTLTQSTTYTSGTICRAYVYALLSVSYVLVSSIILLTLCCTAVSGELHVAEWWQSLPVQCGWCARLSCGTSIGACDKHLGSQNETENQKAAGNTSDSCS